MASIPQHLSKTNEWYTPAWVIDLVRATFQNNVIDLDPASSHFANNTVRANKFYAIHDDGLELPWYGSVFCNPPYGRFVSAWVNKMIHEYESGNIKEGILLVNANTSTKWFQRLFDYHVCFVTPRIAFIDQDGNEQNSPPNANAIIYLGKDASRFEKAFSSRGRICSPNQTP
jgi:phage N-6-adenine-methyltransferase